MGGAISTNREIAKVQADYLAVANDLEQAQALTSALEIQLSGKSNELAHIKAIWEKTQADLARFSQDLETMRTERHRLANEAQRGMAFEFKLNKLQENHDELTVRAKRLEAELVSERAARVRAHADLENLRAQPGGSRGGAVPDAQLKRALEDLRGQLDRVLGGSRAAMPSRDPLPARGAADTGHIDIEFSA